MQRQTQRSTSAALANPRAATTLEEAPSATIEIDEVMPGALVIHAGDQQIALGFPEEVVKAWLRAGKQVSGWLIPDLRSAAGVVQWALEFPLYHALFFQGLFGKGQRMPVYLTAEDWPELCEYLRLTLLGLDAAEMERVGVEPATAGMLAAESAHLALKHKDGRVARIEDFLEPHFFDAEGVVEAGALRIKRHGENTYSFFTADDRFEELRLEPASEPAPPYAAALPAASVPVLPQPFELLALGTSHGFDPAAPCTSFAVQANGRFLLVDAGPHLRTLLRHAGIAPSQIAGVVVTHAHEDHAVGLLALLGLPRRPRLYLTRETAEVLRRKLAILSPTVANPATLLDDAFELCPVCPGVDAEFGGLRLRFHYTFHSIPCTGVELSLREAGGVERRVLIAGDNASRASIERAGREGLLSAERLAGLLALYRWSGDLVVADAGAGQIHGIPADFRGSPAGQVLFVHASALPEEESGVSTLGAPGHRYTLIAENLRPSPLERSLAYRALADAFQVVDPDALSALLDGASAESANRGQVVVREGESSRDGFVTLSGELEVVARREGQARRVAGIRAGEVFGEMAAINQAPRSASVVARTPVRLVRIGGDALRRFALAAGLYPSLPETWKARADLDRVPIFADASVTTRNAIARRAVRRSVDPGATLIREGSPSTTVYVLCKGRVQVYRGSEPLLLGGAPVILDPGAVIGETAPFLTRARNASIVTLDECEVLAIRGADFKQVVQRSPELHCSISKIVAARRAA
jgi:CRP-like cAMP-binding protein/glyoxylase-like metal-dependent hydrolase (beta-lactamase superfamily II)